MSGSSAKSSLLRSAVWALGLRGPAAEDSTAQTLHLLMLMLLLVLGIHVGLAEILNRHKVLVTVLGIPMLGTPVAALVLLRKIVFARPA